jgi:hypothetical protein
MATEEPRTRATIIESMCLTWRHDYRLDKGRFCGMTDEERSSLRHQMAKIFDNDIAPFMEFKKEPRRTELVGDGIIKVHSFELTEREQRRINLGLRHGPASASMRDDGTFFESPSAGEDGKSWMDWLSGKFLKSY